MLKKNVVITFMHISAFIAFSQSNNIRIVEQNAQSVIDSIILEIGDSNTYCLQKCVEIENKQEWISIPAVWHIPSSIDTIPSMPKYRSCLYISGKRPVNDNIIIKDENDSLIVPLIILTGDSLKKIDIRFVTPPHKRHIRDTVKASVRISNERGLFAGDICLDSMYYTLLNSTQKDIKSEIIVNSTKRSFKTHTNQCFSDGLDTFAIIFDDSSLLGNTFRISVSCKGLSDTTDESSLLPANSVSNSVRYLEGKKNVVLRNGHIQFSHNIKVTLTISVIKINGQLIHRGIYDPNKNSCHHYVIPISMMSPGCYLLDVKSERTGSIYCGTIVR